MTDAVQALARAQFAVRGSEPASRAQINDELGSISGGLIGAWWTPTQPNPLAPSLLARTFF